MRFAGSNLDASGHLSLSGESSRLTVNSSNFHNFSGDNFGWFDLEIVDSADRQIWLHNALSSGRWMPGVRQGVSVGTYTTKIYPNYAVIDADQLGKARKVKQVNFQLSGLDQFFINNLIEWQSGYDLSPPQQQLLKSLRMKGTRDYGFFDPHNIILLHRSRSVLQFKVSERTYRISIGLHSSSKGWTNTNLRTVPTASIRFSKPVEFEDALQRVWEWQQFFSQVAVKPMCLTAMSMHGPRSAHRAASVYIPNWREVGVDNKAGLGLSPHYIPYSDWKSRRELGRVMQAWLCKSDNRRFFRGAIGKVISSISERSDTVDITLLCAAVESLDESNGSGSYTKCTIRKMAEAATSASTQNDIERVKGLLGQLNRPSLKQRLQWLCKQTADMFCDYDTEAFINECIRLRNDISHGKMGSGTERGQDGPLIEMLLCLCILYDQHLAGMPNKLGCGKNLLAAIRARDAWMAVKQFESGGRE